MTAKGNLFQRILVPVDFSELSALALKYGVAGALQFGAELVVLHAERFEVPPYVLADEYDRTLSELQQRRKNAESYLAHYAREVLGATLDHIVARFLIVEAHPVDAILQAAVQEQADLIVMGTHGRTGWQRFTLGSVTERVVRSATVPVFVVRQKEREFIDVSHPEAMPRIQRILCPVNFTPVAQQALHYAAAIAARFGAKVTALHIDEHAHPDLEQLKAHVCQWLPETVSHQCPVEVKVRRGHAAEQIVAEAQEGDHDLLVIGADRRPFLSAFVFGSTTELLLRHSPLPTLIVPSAQR